jgi:density-regulated protein DRP1
MVTWSVIPSRSSFPPCYLGLLLLTCPLLSPRVEALEAATASLSVAAQERAAKDAAKKAAKAEAAEQRQADKLAHSVVTIKRIERNKRKYVTAVIGLEAFGLDLKKVRPFT